MHSSFLTADGSLRHSPASQDGAAGRVGGFSLHADLAAETHESQKLERLCRYFARPAISQKRLSISPQGRGRQQNARALPCASTIERLRLASRRHFRPDSGPNARPGKSVLRVLAAACLHAAMATGAAPEVASYRVEQYTAVDGLDSESLLHVSRLADGRIAIVGVRGEPRIFDGYRFEAPWRDATAPAKFDGGFATAAVGDDLWVASQRTGLHRIGRSGTEQIELPDDANPALIVLGKEGQDLLVPSSQGVFRVALDSTRRVRRVSPPTPFLSVAETPDGKLYAAGAGGLVQLHEGEARPVLPWLSGVHIWSLHVDRRGRLMVATRGLGLVILGPDGAERIGVEQGLPHSVVRAVAEVGEHLWLATAGGGLARVSPDRRVEVFNTAHGLSSDTLTWVTADERGVLWVTTAGAGLNRLWPSPFSNFTDAVGQRGGFHYSLLRDRSDRLWIGSNQGLAQLVDGIKVPMGAPGPGQASTVLGMVEIDDGFLLSTRRGLFHYQPPARFRPVAEERNWPAPILFHSARHGVLVGQAQQLYRYRGGRFEAMFQAADGSDPARRWPSQATLRTLHEDAELGLLLGTSHGAFRSDGERLEAVGPERAAHGFWRDGERLFITGSKLGVYTRDSYFELPLRTDKGPNATLFSMWGDDRDGVWITSHEGLLRLSRRRLSAARPGATLPATVFGRGEGLPSTEFEGGHQSMLAEPDGSLLFTSTGGVTRLDPRQVGGGADADAALSPLRLVLSGIEDDVRSYAAETGVILPPGTRRVAIKFAALPAARSASARLRYRLHPVEDQYRPDRSQGQAIYGALQPGRYRFDLEAEVAGVATEQARLSYAFEIAPRPLERRDVQLALGLGVIALIALLPTLHIRSLRAQRRRLIAAVAERTAELERLARTDVLTGLLNRRSLEEALADVLQRPAPVGLILIDVDHFKKYNDHFGHQAGDRCLRSVADALSHTVAGFPEAYPRLVARFGGEEFVVLCAAADLAALSDRAERLRAAVEALALEHPSAPGGTVTLSLGYTLIQTQERGELALSRADQALYRAKAGGRNRAQGA
ncbi:MAG: diguanylate cyclase [Rhodanobacteraceae bacterium]|nr:diguanylate cyclase [Rhodanobacteraceae bacterium]